MTTIGNYNLKRKMILKKIALRIVMARLENAWLADMQATVAQKLILTQKIIKMIHQDVQIQLFWRHRRNLECFTINIHVFLKKDRNKYLSLMVHGDMK